MWLVTIVIKQCYILCALLSVSGRTLSVVASALGLIRVRVRVSVKIRVMVIVRVRERVRLGLGLEVVLGFRLG